MPKSKRAKVVHLSKTTKKGKELTLRLFSSVQECVPEYAYIYVFRVDNMRNTYLKEVRSQLADSRIFFGKTKVMAVALGLTPATEVAENTSLLAPYLHGSVGLIFSKQSPQQICEYFRNFRPADYARSGTPAARTFVVPSGTVYSHPETKSAEDDVPLAHSIEPTLRKLGMPSRLVKGKIELDQEYTVCTKDEILTSAQTQLLKIFDLMMATFEVEILAWYEASTASVTANKEQVDDMEIMA